MTALWTRIKPYLWIAGALALLVLGYLFASSRMRAKALEKQVEALQALRESRRRRKDRDDRIDADADAERDRIEAERDRAVDDIDARDAALPPADHDALDAVDDEVNAYLKAKAEWPEKARRRAALMKAVSKPVTDRPSPPTDEE